MAKNYGFLICIFMIIMDVIAGILGIEAEIDQNKVNELRMWIFECRDPSYLAFKLGLAAAILMPWLMIALAVGFSMLIIGTLANSRTRKSCGIAHHRFLSIGGILCIIHGLFIVCYYVSATATKREEKRLPGNPT